MDPASTGAAKDIRCSQICHIPASRNAGAGRRVWYRVVAITAARLGAQVTGIDLTPQLLEARS